MTALSRFGGLQLRSVIDDVGAAAPDPSWAALLASGDVLGHCSSSLHLSLPQTAAAESSLLQAVDALSAALLGGGGTAFADMYRCWGWTSPEQYFAEMGAAQVMLLDVDHNDMDDRLAVLLLAWQMASASAALRAREPCHTCTLYCDVRTYEAAGGPTLWRSLRLAANVCAALPPGCGLELFVVLSDSSRAVQQAASYLGVDPDLNVLDKCTPGVGRLLRDAAGEAAGGVAGGCCGSWGRSLMGSATASLWVLAGVCASQMDDLETSLGHGGPRWNIFEQAGGGR